MTLRLAQTVEPRREARATDRRDEAVIGAVPPEFMDCLRITGDSDYIAFTCSSNTQSLNALLDEISNQDNLGIKNIKTRIILERSKWYLGYPLSTLKWIEDPS